MVETQKEKEDRMRREATRTDGTDPNLGAVNSLPTGRTTQNETRTTETTVPDTRSMTERITPGMTGEDRARAGAATGHSTSQDKPLTGKTGDKPSERTGTIPPTRTTTTTGTTKDVDWDKIQHPGMEPCDEPYGTRPVSEITPPTTVTDKADLAAIRMMDKEKADREKMDREKIMSTATMDAAAARAAMTSKEMTPTKSEAERERMKAGASEEMAPAGTQGQHWRGEPWAKNPTVGGKESAEAEAEAARGRMMTEPGAAGAVAMTPAEIEAERERTKAGAAVAGATMATGAAAKQAESETDRDRMKTGAVVAGAALATGAAVKRTEPAAGERTTRQGAAIGTEPTKITPERPMTGTVVPPGTTIVTPMKPYGTVDERTRMHAEDPSVHPDWETQPQINAPRDVGIQTPEGQADAARLRAGERRSDAAKEPRIDRRGGEYDVPAASGARAGGVTGAVKETARDVKEKAKETTSEVKKDVDRKI
jgi:hypothetical protein